MAQYSDYLRTQMPIDILPIVEPITEQPKRQWQFLKYGDNALTLCQNCRRCKLLVDTDRFYGWALPAKQVRIGESIINLHAGICHLYRAKLLKAIVKSRKSKVTPTYDNPKFMPAYYNCYEEETIELLVDGKSIANINGDYKRGMIKELLKPYTTKVRIGRKACTIPVGEADRTSPVV